MQIHNESMMGDDLVPGDDAVGDPGFGDGGNSGQIAGCKV